MILGITLTNIGAYERAFFSFAEGKNVIIGDNGSGKTTLLKAIAFGLFANTKLLGDMNLGDFLREGEDEGTIEMTFTDARRQGRHEIRRTIKRSGDRVNTESELLVNETQKIIGTLAVNEEVSKLLGIEPKLWSETTWGKQGEISAILDGKKEVFDRMMGIDVYEDAWAKLRGVKNKFENEQRSATAIINEIQSLIADKEKVIVQLKEAMQQLEELKVKHKHIGGDGNDTMSKFNDVNEKITSLRSSISVYQSKIEEKRQLIDNIGSLENCPTCLQPVSEDHKNHIKDENMEDIIALTEQADLVEGEMAFLLEEKKELETALQHVQESGELKGSISTFEDHVIPELDAKIKKINESETKINEKKSKLERSNRLNELVDHVRNAFRAVQPRIRRARIKQVQRTTIDVFNDLFGDEYDAIEIDPKTFRMIVYKDGEERKVSVMSGGERVALGIAMRIAIAKEVGGQDLLILDEPMGQLDHVRKSQLIDLLENLVIDTQLIMVTHDEMLSGASDVLIKIKKTTNGSIPVTSTRT